MTDLPENEAEAPSGSISGYQGPEILTETRAGETELMQPWMPAFLEAFKEGDGHVHKAVRKAGISRAIAYDWRNKDPLFRERWDEVTEALTDGVEVSMLALARDGQVEPIVGKDGEVKGERVTRYPGLIEFALSSRRPQTYRPKKDDDGKDAPPPTITTVLKGVAPAEGG